MWGRLPGATGQDRKGKPVYLRDIWPAAEEIRDAIAVAVAPQQFKDEYGHIFEGDDHWRGLPSPSGAMYEWDPASTYVREPPFFSGITGEIAPPADIVGARCLAKVGDSVTTDHISPAGSIKADSPAGAYLLSLGVEPRDFNSYGSRRGNHEVMLRGTFANPRLRNEVAPETEGPWTVHLPDGEQMSVYDAAMRYLEEGVPLCVIAGKEYGSGSSRDWAAKGPALLGVRFVLSESYERIHRSNLVGMGVLPLQFPGDMTAESLELTGRETFTIRGLADRVAPREELIVQVTRADGNEFMFPAIVRVDEPAEVEYYHQGGILKMVLRSMLDGLVP